MISKTIEELPKSAKLCLVKDRLQALTINYILSNILTTNPSVIYMAREYSKFKVNGETRKISAGENMIDACEDLFSNYNLWLLEFK
jgi:hypothetical protein